MGVPNFLISWKYLLSGLLCLATAGWGNAQSSLISGTTFREVEGLSCLRNTYINQDNNGFVWIGGFEGLVRYDGVSVKTFLPTLSNGLPSPNITSKVLTGPNGNPWFSSSGALHHINRLDDRIISVQLAQPDNEHGSSSEHVLIHIDPEGKIWAAANGWLHRYDPVLQIDSLVHPISTFSCFALADNGGKVCGVLNLLAGEGGGMEVFSYKKGQIDRRRCFTGLGKEPLALVLFAMVEGDSLAWCPSDKGLIKLDLRNPESSVIYALNLPQKIGLLDIAAWNKNQLIVLSNGKGAYLFDKSDGSFEPFWIKIKPNLPLDPDHIAIGRDGTVWLSEWDKGIYFAAPNLSKFKWLKAADVNLENITSIYGQQDGTVWVCSKEEGIISILPSGELRRMSGAWNSHRVYCDHKGNVWAMNASTLFRRIKGENRFEPFYHGFNRLYSWCEISRKEIGLVCPSGIFLQPESKKLEKNGRLDIWYEAENLFDVFSDNTGSLFLSDEIDKMAILNVKENPPGLIREFSGLGYANGMVTDDNIRWFGTNKGLWRLDARDYSIRPDNLIKIPVNAILKDRQSRLWLSSNSGLYRYDPANGEVKHFTESDGLQGLQFIPGSAAALSDGRLAFGGVNGLNLFHPDSILDNPNPPPIHFTNWILNDTGSISTAPEYLPPQTFSYERRTHSFYFTGIDFSAPEEVRYRYLLKGYDQDTVEGGNRGFARYAQLPAGRYTFQVWAANSDGVWTTHPRELSFTVLSPWYATWWAYTLYVLALGIAIYLVYRNHVARIRRSESMKRREAEFRQKEAEAKQVAAEWQNAVLRLQMNPHFLFNSMNSISSYLLQKDVTTAQDYLARFSRLMRRILELAAQPLISIAEETELLEQYMSVESMRFETGFRWTIRIAPDLDPDEVQVPTMILQPFVENAIWHGISGNSSQGSIQIRFELDSGMLRCIVEDNGRGRKSLFSSGQELRKLTAIQITEQRLAGLKQVNGQQPSLQIHDLFHPDGKPAGTRIVIWLPPDL